MECEEKGDRENVGVKQREGEKVSSEKQPSSVKNIVTLVVVPTLGDKGLLRHKGMAGCRQG